MRLTPVAHRSAAISSGALMIGSAGCPTSGVMASWPGRLAAAAHSAAAKVPAGPGREVSGELVEGGARADPGQHVSQPRPVRRVVVRPGLGHDVEARLVGQIVEGPRCIRPRGAHGRRSARPTNSASATREGRTNVRVGQMPAETTTCARRGAPTRGSSGRPTGAARPLVGRAGMRAVRVRFRAGRWFRRGDL
jgi:hypothetical protein